MSPTAENDAAYVRRPFGVWGFCDDCQHDAWVVVVERDYMDEPVAEACGGGCRNCAECADLDYWMPDDETRVLPPGKGGTDE